jgi:hypothetical protein
LDDSSLLCGIEYPGEFCFVGICETFVCESGIADSFDFFGNEFVLLSSS